MAHQTAARVRAGQAKAALRHRVASLDSNPRLKDEHRQCVKADLFLRTDKVVAEERAAHAAEVASMRRSLEQRAFSYEADPDAFRSALSDAASRIATPSQATSALARANRTGDAISAHAIFTLAHERNYVDAVRSYLADHPSTASALQNLAAFVAADEPEPPFGELRPPILPAGLPRDPARLAKLAEQSGEPPAGQIPGIHLLAP